MVNRVGVGGILLLAGMAIVIGSFRMKVYDLMWLGMVVFTMGLLLIPSQKPWYCAQCGQFLGRGNTSSSCERCGSNRVTNTDPGVGDVVRVK